MLWLEMSRDEAHGGGTWGFGQALWSPTHRTDGTKWAFWQTLLRVEAGDTVLHLRGKGEKAAFVGVSTARSDGEETDERPPEPGEWAYAKTFYRVPLQDFTRFHDPVALYEVFTRRDPELRSYFQANRSAAIKERLFYVIQAGRLQCLNGAYLSEVSATLARLLLHEPVYTHQRTLSLVREVSTDEQLRNLLARVGQREFSERVCANYSTRCCFPGCDVAERAFLRGAHIARWADAPELRGDLSNGLCLCLMHDQAFERGLFTIDLECRVWVNSAKAHHSPWATSYLLPFHAQPICVGKIAPSHEALLRHWERTRCYPA
jgi:putative restriction endonuclease